MFEKFRGDTELIAAQAQKLDRDVNQPRPPRLGRLGKPEEFSDRLVLAVEDHDTIVSVRLKDAPQMHPGGYSEFTVRGRNPADTCL